EFDYNVYLLGYFLYPGYRGLGLKRRIFRRIYEIVAKQNKDPFDMEYKNGNKTSLSWWLTFDDDKYNEYPLIDLATKIFSIFYRDRQHNLDVHHIESMAKIYSYYLMNIKKKLTHYKNNLTQQELRDSVNDTIISNSQLLVNTPTDSSPAENHNLFRNMDYSTEDLVNRMFEMNNK
ncbi:30167_t:CDS:2, partial [Gigaspora margarita]